MQERRERSHILLLERLTLESPYAEVLKRYPWGIPLLSDLYRHHPPTVEHLLRVTLIGHALSQASGFAAEETVDVDAAHLLHDIGKRKVDAKILDLPSFTDVERAIVDAHPRTGFEIVREFDPHIAQILVAHHEFQERHYPRKFLRGMTYHNLEYCQRLVALSDQTDASMSDRPDQPALSAMETQRKLIAVFPSNLVDIAVEARTRIAV